MATRYWLPTAPKTAQVSSATVGSYSVGTTYSVTIGTIVISVVGQGGSATTTAAALLAAIQASTAAEFGEITWSVNGAVLIGTAQTAGKPFTAVSAAVASTGTFGAFSDTTANSSPNDVGSALNWGGTVPTGTDSIVIENNENSLLWRLDTLAAVAIASCIIRSTFTGQIGLPTVNDAGYVEYRPTEWQFSTLTVLQQSEPTSTSAAMRKFAVGTNLCTATFIGSGQGAEIGSEVTWWRGTNASNVVHVQGASLAICPISSTTATVVSLDGINGAVIRGGSGLGTVTTVVINNTTFDVQSAITTLTVDGGSQMITRQTMTVGTFNLYSGSCIYNSTGPITTLILGSQDGTGAIDFSQAVVGVTITNLVNAYKGATFNDPLTRVTLGASIKIPKGRLSDITYDFGIDRTYTMS